MVTAPHELEVVLHGDDPCLVPKVRRFVGRWMGKVLRDDAEAWRAEFVSHELLETAFRCAPDHTARLSISVVSDRECHRIIISSHHRATPEQVMERSRAVAELRRSGDAFAHYQALLRGSPRANDAQLALARIAAEAEMELESFALDGEIAVVARTTVQRKG